MKAISIKQPWAWAILNAGKDVENRTWRTKFRGRLLIHAGKSVDTHGIQYLKERGLTLPGEFETGGIVGSVIITDCVDESESSWFFGPHGFVLIEPMKTRFIPMKGKLGIFETEYLASHIEGTVFMRKWCKECQEYTMLDKDGNCMRCKPVKPFKHNLSGQQVIFAEFNGTCPECGAHHEGTHCPSCGALLTDE